MKLDVLKSAVSEDRIENGAWLHFDNPITGEAMYLDPETKRRPTRALVRSIRSKVFRDKAEQISNRITTKTARATKSQRDKIFEEEQKLERPRKLAVIFAGLENGSTDGPAMQPGPTEDECIVMCADSTIQWMVDAIFDFAANDEKYGVEKADPAPAGNAAAPSPSIDD